MKLYENFVDNFFGVLRTQIIFEEHSARVHGGVHPLPRLTKWYGNVEYRYSGISHPPEVMPPLVEDLRDRVSAFLGTTFNSVLCNLYRDGQDTVGWHADDEAIFGGPGSLEVASLSFGSARVFQLRRIDDPKVRVEYLLGPGSLFHMERGVQAEWQHRIPRTSQIVGPRINLTFRRTLGVGGT